MFGGSGRTRAMLLAAVGAVAVGIGILCYATGIAHETELGTVNSRFSIRGDEGPRDDIVLVQIDAASQDELGIFPFPRSFHGRVIDSIDAAGAKAIAYDVEFRDPSPQLREDYALADAIDRTKPGTVVLADTAPNERGESGVFGGQAILDQLGARAGNTQIGEDSDGVRRRVPLSVGGLKTFPFVTVEAATGEIVDEADLGGDSAWIDFAGPSGTYPSVPFSEVHNGEVDPGFFKDKIVVIGASDPSLKDITETSTAGGDEPMSGPESQANTIATALDGFPLQSIPLGLDLLLITLMGLVAPAACYRLPTLRALTLALAAGALYLVAAQLAFNADHIWPVVYPLLALGIGIVGSLGVNYLLEAFERQRVRDTFARFVPEQVVGEVLARTDDDLRLGGRQMVLTVLFSDIRGFTTFSETREPAEVLEILNRYHGEMTEAVMGHGGTLISFIGDGIMAVYGAPIEYPDHADRALASAQEMLSERLPRFNEWMGERGVGQEFQIGIGLNSGPVMVGNIGSRRRLDYTAIGDTTNTAARLEGMTKGTPWQLYLSDSTREALQAEPDDLEQVGEFEVRGRKAKIQIWTLPSTRYQEPSEREQARAAPA